MTKEEAQRARAEGLRRFFADPERSAECRRKKREMKYSAERNAQISATQKGVPRKKHTEETKARIGEIVRQRYAAAKAEWVSSGGKAELVGNLKWARIDWDLARELQAEGATIDDLASFFRSQRSVIRHGLKHGR